MKHIVHLSESERGAVAIIIERTVGIRLVGNGLSYRMVDVFQCISPCFQSLLEARAFMAALTQERVIVHLFTRRGPEDCERVTHLVDPIRLLEMLERCDAVDAASGRGLERSVATSP